VELDVHASGDGTVFVHHDPVVALPGPEGTVAMRPLARLSREEIATVRLHGDIAIPTLDETLEAIGNTVRVFIEIKAIGIEADVVRCLDRHAAIIDSCAVHAFDHRVVKRLLELRPSVRTGILQVGYPIDSCANMRAAGASDLWQHWEFVDHSLVTDVHSRGGRVIAWTANDESQWATLTNAGVDGICTDNVDGFLTWRASLQP
jgi:glycerophosphoryl diester phosphodiesterase